jgi:hypothetical protein
LHREFLRGGKRCHGWFIVLHPDTTKEIMSIFFLTQERVTCTPRK